MKSLSRRARVGLWVTAGIGVLGAATAGTVVANASTQNSANEPLPVATATTSAAPPAGSDGGPAPMGEVTVGPLGKVAVTGLKIGKNDVVIYATAAYAGKTIPDVTFALHAGLADSAGHIVDSGVETNETQGSGKSAGFHAAQRGLYSLPSFGYYVGPAAKITVQADGKTVTAGQARWSEDPNVVFWWFDPAKAPASARLTGLAAYDSAGKQLPGTAGFSAG